MISVRDKINKELFVCPVTKARLRSRVVSVVSAYSTQRAPKVVGLPWQRHGT